VSLPPPTGTLADEAVRAAAVALAMALAFAVAEAWRHHAAPPAEWTRKFIHSAVGVVCMTFPWVFARAETPILLGVASGALLLVARRAGWFPSLFAVERGSWGELYFPAAAILCFT
jgi:hypothetical protein